MRRKPGLPTNFDLGLTREDLDGPADVGDFLDEDDSYSAKPKARGDKSNPPKASKVAGRISRTERAEPAPAPVEPEPETAQEDEDFQELHARRPPPRRQINMTKQTMEMADDLLERVQRYSLERNAKSSEIFSALVAAAYEARGELDLSTVPARGKWGSPTAKTFVDSLKAAFQQAIAQHQRHQGEVD